MVNKQNSQQEVKDVDVEEGKKLVDRYLGTKDFELLDVRTAQQHQASHIEGSKLIELQELDLHLDKMDKNKYYVVYCRIGKRSDTAAQMMRLRGFRRVSNLLGGILAWAARSFPIKIGK